MRLFKYLPPERTDVLKNHNIRFTQAKYLNDPFEWLPFVQRLMSELASNNFYNENLKEIVEKTLKRQINFNDIPEEFRSQIPEEILAEVVKHTIGESLLPGLHPEDLVNILFSGTSEQHNINISEVLKKTWNKYFGVLSLTQSNDNIPMWSHYSKNHEGFVIEFDPESVFFKQAQDNTGISKVLRKVDYIPQRRNINLFEAGDTEHDILNRIALEIFFTKSIHWADEKEVRVIDKLSNSSKQLQYGDQEIFLFDFEPEAIKTIYFGVNISEFTLNEINSITRTSYQHINRYTGQLDLREYRINFLEE